MAGPLCPGMVWVEEKFLGLLLPKLVSQGVGMGCKVKGEVTLVADESQELAHLFFSLVPGRPSIWPIPFWVGALAVHFLLGN